MGYTHYWERPAVLPLPQFIAAAEDCRRLCEGLAMPLGCAAGNDSPEFSANQISFNGVGAAGCESFVVQRIVQPRHPREQPDQAWRSNFCKTNYRPYDLCVQGALIVLSHHLGSTMFRVTSDGQSRDWNAARTACQRILGYGGDWGQDRLVPLLPQPVA